jgi:UDP-N-acetylmuramate: L-alanyl-gamma-D-glutamyl-meso-diaminopimelate ligase
VSRKVCNGVITPSRSKEAIIYQPEHLGWDLSLLLQYANNIQIIDDLEAIIDRIKAEAGSVCHVLLMSNGGFGDIYQRIKNELT